MKIAPKAAVALLPAAIVQKGFDILNKDNKTFGVRTVWKEFEDFLEAQSLSYDITAESDVFVVHEENRGKQGLKAFRMHIKGVKICKGGADRELIQGARAIEMSPDPAEADKQFRFAEELADRTPDIMAPVTRRERYRTIGAGHLAGFFKAVKAKTKTPCSEAADAQGVIDITPWMKKSSELTAMVTAGWSWKIIRWQVEATWGKRVAAFGAASA